MNMDEQTMAEEIGRLRQVEETLKEKLDRANKAKRYAEVHRWFSNAFVSLTFCIILLAGVGGLGAVIYMSAITPAKPTHCVIERSSMCSFELVGVVPWGSNITYGKFERFDTAVEKAKLIKCRVEVSP